MNFSKQEVLDLLSKIKIVKVISFKKNENSDHLLVVQIETGEGIKQIVTGADNFKEGDLVPYLGIGETVPGFLFQDGTRLVLEKRRLRGYESEGMILAEDEIGLSDDHEGIFVVNTLGINNKDDLIGKTILDVLDEEKINNLMKRIEEKQIDIQGLKSVTEEILGEEDLLGILKRREEINHYIGFEISGLVHLGTGIMSGLVIRELQKLGVKTKVFLADWHTWMNNKLNGDTELIKKVALEYFGPALKVSAQIAGADPEKIELVLGSDLYHENDRYWQTVIEVSKNLTLSRVLKSTTILGREESDSMEFAMLVYPPMQVADIFEMKNHIAHAGTDQRKCHVIAREVATKLNVNPLLNSKGEKMKPVAIHHSLVAGLQAPAQWPLPESIDIKQMLTTLKMSKSVEGSAIFIHDEPEQIRNIIRKAFCPEKEVEYNPILNWIEKMIFPIEGKFELIREERFGGNRIFETFEDLKTAYASGEVYPLDLKNNVAETLIRILEPARAYFNNEKSQELIKVIKNIKKKR